MRTRQAASTPLRAPGLFDPTESACQPDALTESGADVPSPVWPDRFGKALRGAFTARRPIRTLSLFTGAGGLDIGFHDAGFEIAEAVEIDLRCVETLRRNTGPGRLLVGMTVRGADIREYTPPPSGRYEFVIGGPPCQTFSAAGRRAAGVSGVNDARGTLFAEFVRVLAAVRPAGFLFENVYGITGANGGAAWEQVRAAFAAAGYRIFHRVLDAADYGVPQHRERAIIVGVRSGAFRFPRPSHGPDSPSGRPHYPAGVAVEGAAVELDAPRGVNGRYGHLLAEVPPGLNYSFFTERMGHPRPVFAWRSKFSDFLYKADPLGPVRTIKAQGGQYTGPFHWTGRPFSVAEFKRLQTFPDAYEFPPGRQAAVKMIGNSVPPQFARMLALAVRAQVFGDDLPWPLEFMGEAIELGFRQRKRLQTTAYREKARTAIRNRVNDTGFRTATESRTYRASMSREFLLESNPDGGLRVEFQATANEWSLGVTTTARSAADGACVAPIRGKSWGLPADRVWLFFDRRDERTFTAVWKAFEAELIRGGYKADLVQLSNYYQYDPTFAAEMKFRGRVDFRWAVLARVCAGVGVAETRPAADLAELWRTPVKHVHEAIRWLRELGYEVRNHRTNGEIPVGSYLIPYAFPTFNPQSVQLRKSLD